MSLWRFSAGILLLLSCAAARAQTDEDIEDLLRQISEQRLTVILQKLVSFETRDIRSDTTDAEHGIGAARNWIRSELQGYSPRLAVEARSWNVRVPGLGGTEVEIQNIVAVLPGKTNTQIVLSAHYDSSSGDPKKPAPGADDDGSGTAAVMELARVLSRYEFDKTVVFMLFAGEEYGLLGSRKEAEKADNESAMIEAVLNNDIIGDDAPQGAPEVAVNAFGGNVRGSLSQMLAQRISDVGQRYVHGLRVIPVPQPDRSRRNGDHTSYQQLGYPAVRLTTPYEIVANQHNSNDTLEHVSVSYVAKVARLNAAAIAVLAGMQKKP